jgi:hypothetical protein
VTVTEYIRDSAMIIMAALAHRRGMEQGPSSELMASIAVDSATALALELKRRGAWPPASNTQGSKAR